MHGTLCMGSWPTFGMDHPKMSETISRTTLSECGDESNAIIGFKIVFKSRFRWVWQCDWGRARFTPPQLCCGNSPKLCQLSRVGKPFFCFVSHSAGWLTSNGKWKETKYIRPQLCQWQRPAPNILQFNIFRRGATRSVIWKLVCDHKWVSHTASAKCAHMCQICEPTKLAVSGTHLEKWPVNLDPRAPQKLHRRPWCGKWPGKKSSRLDVVRRVFWPCCNETSISS